jgi:hypothetical protein
VRLELRVAPDSNILMFLDSNFWLVAFVSSSTFMMLFLTDIGPD